jgi:hypothetical protein
VGGGKRQVNEVQMALTLYHFMDAQFLLGMILNKRIKLSTFKNLNDPYESLPIMRDGNIYAPVVLVRHHIHNMLKNTGLLSLSKNIQSSAMWGIYASRHKGVALKFQFDKNQSSTLFKVVYDDKRVEFPNNDDRPSDELLKRLLETKARCWRYEAEYRWVFPMNKGKTPVYCDTNGLIYCSIPKELKGIILGVDCDLIEGVVVNALTGVGLADVSVTRAKLSNDSFNIIIDPTPQQKI